MIPDIFDAKIIHYQDKLDGAPFVAPETRCHGYLVLATFLELRTQQAIGEFA